MKNKLKKLLRLGFTLFTIGLLMTNCEKDNTHEDATQIENQEPTFTIKQYSRENIEKNTKLVSRLKEFNDNLIEKKSAKTSGKNAYNKEYDFTIYTDSATYIQNGDYHSYTFPIVQGADDKITNVLFELNDEDEYDAFLVEYDYSANEFNTLDLSSLSLVTSMEPIDFDFNSLSARTRLAYVCIYTYERHCYDGWVDGSVGNLVGADNNNEGCWWSLKAGSCETVLYADEDYTNYHNNNTATVTIGGTTYGGTSGGSSTSPMPSPFDSEELMKINVVKSELELNHPERLWIDEYINAQIAFKLYDFGVTHMWSEEVKVFAKDLINVARLDSVIDVGAFNFVLEAYSHNKIYNAFDQAFLTSVNQFTNIDTSNNANIDPVYIHFVMKCIALRAAHPDWSDIKIYWEASKDIVHLTLDALGLIPVFGEPADIINGVIYTFEGEALDASLSFAGAIPFVGWLSTGTKISIKVINQTTQGVIGLVWKVSDSGLITFGNRNILKHVIGSAGTGMHAHHIMPWDFRNNPLVQKAANSDFGFNMNELSNGFPLPSSNHLTGHNSLGGYNDTIQAILTDNQALIDNMNPNEAYNFLSGLTNHIKQLLETNSDLNLGQIADLISYP